MIKTIDAWLNRQTRNDLNDNFKELDERIDNIVKNEDDGNLEVVDSRNSTVKGSSYDTLGKRLDAAESDTTTKRDKSVKLTQADFDTSNEGSKLTPNHLSQEVKNMMSGSTPVSPNLADGQVTTQKIADKSVTDEKILSVSASKLNGSINTDKVNGFTLSENVINLFRVEDITPDKYLNNNGDVQSHTISNVGGISGYIEVLPGKTYEFSRRDGTSIGFLTYLGAYYTSEKVKIGVIPYAEAPSAETSLFTVPNGCKYIRINYAYIRLQSVFFKEYFPKIFSPGLVISGNNIKDNSITDDKIDSISIHSCVEVEGVSGDIIQNLFDKATITEGKYLNNYGSLGTFSPFDGGVSDFISVEPGKTYEFITNDNTGGFLTYVGGYFDSQKRWISSIQRPTTSPLKITIPEDIYFVRINYAYTHLNDFYFKLSGIEGWTKIKSLKIGSLNIENKAIGLEHFSDELLNSILDNRFYNKKISFLGDSLTVGVGSTSNSKRYSTLTCERIGSIEQNLGISGTCITERTTSDNAFVNRVSTIANDTELIVIFGGTNDHWNNVPLGNETSTDKKELFGALNIMISAIKTTYPNAEIIFILPHKQYWENKDSDQPNSIGKKLKDYCDAIKNRCEHHSLSILNFYNESGFDVAHNDTQRGIFTTDGVHLTNEGYERLSNRLVANIKSL